MLRNNSSHQAEHTDRSITHHDVGHADHHVAHDVKELVHCTALLSHRIQAETEHDGKEDDLKNRALGEGFHRIDRDDFKQRLHKARGIDLSGLQAFGRERHAHARINHVGDHEAEDHGDGRRDHKEHQRTNGNTAEFRDVADTGGTGHQGGEHQRHDHHADQTNEQVAQRTEPGLREFGVGKRADNHTQHQTEHHLHRQAGPRGGFLVCHNSSPFEIFLR